MPPKSLPTEFAINMYLDKIAIIQQGDLDLPVIKNYFDLDSPCHIYFVCKRPRITINPDSFHATDIIELIFRIQRQNEFEDVMFRCLNDLGADLVLKSEYPYSHFTIGNDNLPFITARASTFVNEFSDYFSNTDFLDLEVLYIGQSYGVDGARTAPDRLKNHSTLQNIYAEAMHKHPDSEICLALASFSQVNFTKMDGRIPLTEPEKKADLERMHSILHKLNNVGINEQQKINFTEAALIRYFEPPYNKEYKKTFPNPAHTTYSECYDLDINSVCIELVTDELINFRFYSETIKPQWTHLKYFLLHSADERKNMFNF